MLLSVRALPGSQALGFSPRKPGVAEHTWLPAQGRDKQKTQEFKVIEFKASLGYKS